MVAIVFLAFIINFTIQAKNFTVFSSIIMAKLVIIYSTINFNLTIFELYLLI